MTMNSIFQQTDCLSPKELENYLQHNLKGAALFKVENHLLDCELCSAAVEGFSSSDDWATELELSQSIDFGAVPETTKVVQMPLIRRAIAVAAMVGLPLVAGLWYWNAQQNERLFSEHYAYYESDVTVTTRGDTDNALQIEKQLKAALEAYESKDFQKSQVIFDKLIAKNKEDIVATFYAGLSSLAKEDAKKSIAYLETVRFNSNEYYEASTWYLALANLKIDKKKEAKALLEDLSTSKDRFYAKQAKTLLAEI